MSWIIRSSTMSISVASRQKGPETIRLNEHGIPNDSFQGEERTIKLFQMTYLQDQAFRFCQVNQFIRFLEAFGDGFFEKDVDSSKQEILCDRVVERRGNSNTYGLNAVQELRVIGRKAWVRHLFGHSPGPGGIDIRHSHQVHSLHPGIFLGVKLAKVADTDDADLDLFHLTGNPPLRLLNEMKEVLDLRQLGDLILSDLFQGVFQGQVGAEDDAVSLL